MNKECENQEMPNVTENQHNNHDEHSADVVNNNDQNEVIDKTSENDVAVEPELLISTLVAQRIHDVVELLTVLSDDIIAQRQKTFDQCKFINEEAHRITDEGIIKFNTDQVKLVLNSVSEFINILDKIIEEVQREASMWMVFISPDSKFKIVDECQQTSDQARFGDNLLRRMKVTKKYVKDVRKDVSVGLSRYTIKFKEHTRKLDYANAYSKMYHEHKKNADDDTSQRAIK